MEVELTEEIKKNQELILAAENLFKERQEKEDIIVIFEAKIEKIRRENNDQINNLVSRVL